MLPDSLLEWRWKNWRLLKLPRPEVSLQRCNGEKALRLSAPAPRMLPSAGVVEER
jgi:hypothetical protein